MISVLLRTRNEQEHIGFCLQSINDVLGRDTEVLIANNNSTDDTVNIIQMFDWMDIELFDINAYTPGETLNYLASKSTNNTLLTLSAHCKLLPNENIGPIVFTDFEAARAVFGKQIPMRQNMNRGFLQYDKYLDKTMCQLSTPSSTFLG